MKRNFLFVVFALAALGSHAAGRYSSEPEMPGWLIFMGLLMFAWGVLEIILFFKVWEMTNDVKALKKDHFNEYIPENADTMVKYLRRNLLLGNKENVKRMLLKNFINDIDSSYWKLPSGGFENGEWVSKEAENLQKPILPYVKKLQQQFEKMGEELPVYISAMKTYGDYFNVFTKEDIVITEAEKEEAENVLHSE